MTRWLPIFIAVICALVRADSRAAADVALPMMSMSPQGELSVSLKSKPVLTGTWALRYWPAEVVDAELALGPIVETTAKQDSPEHATVTHTYAAAVAAYDYRLRGEDLTISLHLQNNDAAKPLKMVRFHGLTFHFARPPTGTIRAHHGSYLDAHGSHGVELYHPSTESPIGSVYATDDAFGFSASTSASFNVRTMFLAGWVKDNFVPAECELWFYTNLNVPPGQAIDLDMAVRISADTSMRHLLAPYKAAFDAHYPKLLYHPDPRPMAQFASVAPQLVTAENPYGFNGPWRRFDTAVGTARFVDWMVPRLVRANAGGCIFWAFGGYNPRGAMYRPDFDELPPAIAANVPALVRGFKSRGLRVGLCARPGDILRPHDATTDELYRISMDNPADVEMVLNRFRHAMAMGFDIFYCDTFAFNDQDLKLLQKIRDVVGPDVLLYTELGFDLTLPLAGRYCEWHENEVAGLSREQYEALRYLCPESTWLCKSRTKEVVPAAYAKWGLVPLVEDFQTPMLPAATRPTKVNHER
jgi:hypothetical protein